LYVARLTRHSACSPWPGLRPTHSPRSAMQLSVAEPHQQVAACAQSIPQKSMRCHAATLSLELACGITRLPRGHDREALTQARGLRRFGWRHTHGTHAGICPVRVRRRRAHRGASQARAAPFRRGRAPLWVTRLTGQEAGGIGRTPPLARALRRSAAPGTQWDLYSPRRWHGMLSLAPTARATSSPSAAGWVGMGRGSEQAGALSLTRHTH